MAAPSTVARVRATLGSTFAACTAVTWLLPFLLLSIRYSSVVFT
jgi:hypothetical protein